MTQAVNPIITFSAALGLAAVHILAGRAHSFGIIPGRAWLSAGGGAAVAYVFVHLLPELDRGARIVGEPNFFGGILNQHIYLLALAGFVLFYGLEQLAQEGAPRESSMSERRVFWVHVGAFSLYNALIGYLMVHRDNPGLMGLLLFTLAMGLHLMVNDHGLHGHFQDRYRDTGRWLLSLAVLIGWAAGQTIGISELLVHMLFALLAGGIVLNVIKEEVPEHCASRFSAFLAGTTGYTVLLLAV